MIVFAPSDRFCLLGMGFRSPLSEAWAGRRLAGSVYQLVDGAEGEGRQCIPSW